MAWMAGADRLPRLLRLFRLARLFKLLKLFRITQLLSDLEAELSGEQVRFRGYPDCSKTALCTWVDASPYKGLAVPGSSVQMAPHTVSEAGQAF